MASDLLEHSSAADFYSKKRLSEFDAGQTLDRVAKLGLVGDFGGARVVTTGAGLLPPDSSATETRDRQALANLRLFWESWFNASHAKLTDYGEPDLMTKL